jgi:hypothetical protein
MTGKAKIFAYFFLLIFIKVVIPQHCWRLILLLLLVTGFFDLDQPNDFTWKEGVNAKDKYQIVPTVPPPQKKMFLLPEVRMQAHV